MKYRTDIELINGIFELIEEDTIDIDKIEELDVIKSRKEIFKTIKEDNGKLDKLYSFQLFVAYEVIDKINELVQTVNQHEKEIKELKSLDIEISEKDINEAIKNAREQLNKEKELNKKYCCNCGVELTEENTALPNMCNECKYGEE